ncbi:MAG: DUF2095 family protein [Candidatus Hydrothermarchaeaceae archaeon]
MEREEFRKKFPNLAKELEGEERITIGGVRSNIKEGEKATKTLERHDPTAIDFLRRCDTCEQGLEIIEYLKARGEIEKEYANSLKVQLLQKGLESFGLKKKPGHYLIK